jgi:asparagine synthase (glutamine-hydrolysing)
MCGIFSILNCDNIQDAEIENEFMKGKKRGPEFSKLQKFYKFSLGFHRLAINGLNQESNQPIIFNNIILICNGEIYNYKELYKSLSVTPITQSDCEVIIHLYLAYGIKQTLLMLDGVFSFILVDNRINQNSQDNFIFIARDPLGVRPLYMLDNDKDHYNLYPLYGFASELKCLEKFYNINTFHYKIKQFTPGTYSVFKLSSNVQSKWEPIIQNLSYFQMSFPFSLVSNKISDVLADKIYENIAFYLKSAIIKRCETTERPVACLLSGGLDSSLIAALVADYFKLNGKTIETYSIGLENSEDIKYARIVANYIGSKHHEIIVTEDDMFNSIPEVIEALESYDTTTVRASLGNYLIGKYISTHSDAKVIFNGDGSDELFGGYLYMNKCPNDIEFDFETRRLLTDIHLFDVLRSDKSISSNGLEPRTPFLDRSFVNYVLSIPIYLRNHNNSGLCEKYLLRNAFVLSRYKNFDGQQILPDEILWRKKEAFSDGVSSQGRSLFQILQEKIALKTNMEPNIQTEKKYYKIIFDKLYRNCEDILPYFWMPKYTNATDPSARTLIFYNK